MEDVTMMMVNTYQGKGWDNENNCYESEKEDDFDEFDEEEEDFNKNFNIGNEEAIDDLEDDLFDIDINEDNIHQIIKECSPFNDKNEEKKKEEKNKEEKNKDEKNEKKEEEKVENKETEEEKEEKEEIEEKEVKKEKEENNEKKDENKDVKDLKEIKEKLEEKKEEKKEEKNNISNEKNNTKQKGKIIITRENQEKYLDGKLLDDIKKNSEELPNQS